MAESRSSAEQVATAVEQETENIIQFVQYFDHLDETSPMLRFIIAGSVVVISLILLLITRFIIRRRMKHLEEFPNLSFWCSCGFSFILSE